MSPAPPCHHIKRWAKMKDLKTMRLAMMTVSAFLMVTSCVSEKPYPIAAPAQSDFPKNYSSKYEQHNSGEVDKSKLEHPLHYPPPATEFSTRSAKKAQQVGSCNGG